MGAIGGMQVGVRQEQVGQVFLRWVFVVQVFVAWLHARLMGYGGVSTGVHLVDVTPLVLLVAESRAGQMSISAVGVANVAPSGSNSTHDGTGGTASGGGLMKVGLMVITGVMWAGVMQGMVPGAGLRVGPVYLGVVVVADVGHSGPSLMQGGAAGTGSGGKPVWAGSEHADRRAPYAMGLRPKASSTSIAQSSCMALCGITSIVERVGVGWRVPFGIGDSRGGE